MTRTIAIAGTTLELMAGAAPLFLRQALAQERPGLEVRDAVLVRGQSRLRMPAK